MLYGWMKSLIIYLIFAGAIINLSPSGSYKKYIRLFTGIVAIIILIKPISYIFNFDETKLYGAINKVEGVSGDYDLPQSDAVTDYYDMSISEAIRLELIDRGFLVDTIEVMSTENGDILSIRVYVDSTSELDRSFEENNIKSFINEVYNLETDNIYVVRR